jgi:hypothetical protein
MSNPEFTAPVFTTQTAATYKANIDASIAANGSDVVNIGFSYASGTGTFTVHDAKGTALASTNPGFIRFQDPDNPGYTKYISVEANQDFIDDNGSSEIVNNLFGATSGVAWGEDVPFYLYAVSNDDMDAVAFMISRIPHRKTSPAVGEIGAPDDAVADNEYSFFSLENLDETVYDSNPCVCIGAFRMQMSASDDWTVQTLSVSDGIGQFHDETRFTLPAGQNGAASGTYIQSNAGTEVTFATNTIQYQIEKNGRCNLYYEHITVNNSPSGAQEMEITTPLQYASGQTYPDLQCIFFDNGTSSYFHNFITFTTAGGDYGGTIRQDGSTTQYLNSTLATSDSLFINGSFLIKDS